jgi:hypothetical protein
VYEQNVVDVVLSIVTVIKEQLYFERFASLAVFIDFFCLLLEVYFTLQTRNH